MECKVCRSPEAGLHYQTNSCRACAAFFRRTVRKRLVYKCHRKNNCDVTEKENRYSCRFCRMKKCVDVGMVMSVNPATSSVNFGTSDELELEDSSQDEQEFYTLENLIGDPEMFRKEIQQRIRSIFQRKTRNQSNVPYSLSLCQEIAIARVNFAQKWPNCTKEKMFYDGVVDFKRGMCDFFKAMEHSAEFCMDIEFFANLPQEQKLPVFKHFVERFFQMDRVFVTVDLLGNDLDDTRMVALSGRVIDFANYKLNVSEVVNMTEERFRELILTSERKVNNLFTAPFKRINADETEINFLFGCCLWSLEGVKGTSEETLMNSERIREQLADELHMHYKYKRNIENYAARTYKLQNLITAMDRIVEMREEGSHMSKMFRLYKVEVCVNDITGR